MGAGYTKLLAHLDIGPEGKEDKLKKKYAVILTCGPLPGKKSITWNSLPLDEKNEDATIASFVEGSRFIHQCRLRKQQMLVMTLPNNTNAASFITAYFTMLTGLSPEMTHLALENAIKDTDMKLNKSFMNILSVWQSQQTPVELREKLFSGFENYSISLLSEDVGKIYEFATLSKPSLVQVKLENIPQLSEMGRKTSISRRMSGASGVAEPTPAPLSSPKVVPAPNAKGEVKKPEEGQAVKNVTEVNKIEPSTVAAPTLAPLPSPKVVPAPNAEGEVKKPYGQAVQNEDVKTKVEQLLKQAETVKSEEESANNNAESVISDRDSINQMSALLSTVDKQSIRDEGSVIQPGIVAVKRAPEQQNQPPSIAKTEEKTSDISKGLRGLVPRNSLTRDTQPVIEEDVAFDKILLMSEPPSGMQASMTTDLKNTTLIESKSSERGISTGRRRVHIEKSHVERPGADSKRVDEYMANTNYEERAASRRKVFIHRS